MTSIDMTSFIDTYLESNGVDKDMPGKISDAIHMNCNLNEFDYETFRIIKVFASGDLLTSSEKTALVMMFCNEKLGEVVDA